MKYPNFNEEKKLWRKGYKKVVGLDEAGRGPLAGPVVAAAVMINSKLKNQKSKPQLESNPSGSPELRSVQQNFPKGIKDSKKLTPKAREEFYKVLTKHPDIEWKIGIVSEKIIDKINIKNAAELAMERAVKKLKRKPDFLIIDGNHLSNYKLKTINYKLIIKADEKVFSCCAASIIAKVARDRIMIRYHKKYPKYAFNKHKGYPTKFHREKLGKYGACVIHRKTFCLFS